MLDNADSVNEQENNDDREAMNEANFLLNRRREHMPPQFGALILQ